MTCRRQLDAAAASVAAGYGELAGHLRHGSDTAIRVPRLPPEEWPDDLGTDLYHLADIRVWLAGLADDLARLARTDRPAVEAAPRGYADRHGS